MKNHPAWIKITLALLLAPLLLAPMRSRAEEGTLTIEAAVQMALAQNERALAADQRALVAQAMVAEARSFFFPTFTLNGAYTRRPFEVSRQIGDQSAVIQSLNAISGNISLNMILFDSTTIPNFNLARLENKAQKYSSAESKRKLSFEVAASYVMTLSADQVYEASRHRYEYAKNSWEAAKARYAAGLVSVNDVTLAELEFATAERGMIQQQGAVQTSYLQLGYLLATVISGKLQVPQFLLDAAGMNPPDVEAAIPEALQRRLDIQSLQYHARALRALSASPTLMWLPAINLVGQYRYTNEAGLTGKSFNWNVGLNFSWSLFDGFYRNAYYRDLSAQVRLAELDAKAAKRLGEVEVRNAWVSLANQQAALKQAQVAFDVARKNASEIAELYRQGLANALQSADANVRLFESEVAMVSTRYSLALALLNLRSAQGLDPFGKEPKI